MGSRMTLQLLKAGHEVVIYNRTASRAKLLQNKGAIVANTPREAAEQADIVISIVTNVEASQHLWLDKNTGAINGLRGNTIAIESSTLTFDWVEQLAEEIISRGNEFLDAPVVGSRPQADAGELIYLVGGTTEALDKARDVLTILSSTIHHTGPIGTGQIMKLAINALFGIQVSALSEILGMLKKHSIPTKQAITLLNTLPTTSPALKGIGSLIASDSYAPLFPINLVEKDFSYVLSMAQSTNASIPITKAVLNIYQDAIKKGYGENNIAGVAQLYL